MVMISGGFYAILLSILIVPAINLYILSKYWGGVKKRIINSKKLKFKHNLFYYFKYFKTNSSNVYYFHLVTANFLINYIDVLM